MLHMNSWTIYMKSQMLGARHTKSFDIIYIYFNCTSINILQFDIFPFAALIFLYCHFGVELMHILEFWKCHSIFNFKFISLVNIQ